MSLLKSFTEYLEEARENNPMKTQVATTGGTYRKTGEFLRDKLPSNSKIISFGAGLDHTRQSMHEGLRGDNEESGHEIHDHEPFPANRKTAPEFTDAEHIPSEHYHAAVSHNVLNVLEPHIRDGVVHHMLRTVKPGGHIVIGTRGWKGDIEKTKEYEPAEEKNAIWVKRKIRDKKTGVSSDSYSYQKGFDVEKSKRRTKIYNPIIDKLKETNPKIRARMGTKSVWDSEVIPHIKDELKKHEA